ncbi:MAG TPA: glycosyltransferase family 2 protein [Bauldia sp.]|nr:glycosyltransferase family 2 protein [Bauldia sp.]
MTTGTPAYRAAAREAPAFASEAAAMRDRARRLGLPFTVSVMLGRPPPVDIAAIEDARAAWSDDGHLFIAPDEDTLPQVRHWLARYGSNGRVTVTTRSAIRAALIRAGAGHFLTQSRRRLEGIDPSFSARVVMTGRQIGGGLAAAALLAAALALAPRTTLLLLGIAAATLFLAISLLRVAAAALLPRGPVRPRLAAADAPDLPVYTVLVPLYREEGMVEQLVAGLESLDWPRDRLDIKLIVEEDDLATRRAVTRAAGGPPFEVIVVPRAAPRTKPKALAFALSFARGSFVTIYDAEDRPHPAQLREAYAAFRRAPAEVACLQAPVIVNNRRASHISRFFSVEYSALFDGLLPALVRLGLPLPLGGTSNHFRREVLEAVGAWDPYNVTEDADLGIRLARFGYRSATLLLPTYEEAPVSFLPWLNQRTRWFKGWIQTWLVHMRQPVRLVREIGFRQFAGFNLVGIGMILSALIHPAYLAALVLGLANPFAFGGDLAAEFVAGISLVNLAAGYLAMAMLSLRTLAMRGRRRDAAALVWMPVYWLMMSLACLRALVEVAARPHHWRKTPHRGRRPAAAAAVRPGGRR